MIFFEIISCTRKTLHLLTGAYSITNSKLDHENGEKTVRNCKKKTIMKNGTKKQKTEIKKKCANNGEKL